MPTSCVCDEIPAASRCKNFDACTAQRTIRRAPSQVRVVYTAQREDCPLPKEEQHVVFFFGDDWVQTMASHE